MKTMKNLKIEISKLDQRLQKAVKSAKNLAKAGGNTDMDMVKFSVAAEKAAKLASKLVALKLALFWGEELELRNNRSKNRRRKKR